MSVPVFVPLPGNEALAENLSRLAHGELGTIDIRKFPDGETYLRFPGDLAGRSLVLVSSLADPDAKIPTLIFAARTARDLGAKKIGLVAPYLCYMRQDTRFKPGEAVTSRYFASLVSENFDWLLTLDPHLHRYASLGEIYTIPARAVHAAPLLGDWIKRHVTHPYLIGPDEESAQWVSQVAQASGAPYIVLHKQRLGDREVRIAPDGLKALGTAVPVVIDDVISSGKTMQEAIRIAAAFSSRKPLAMAVHGIFAGGADRMLEREGAQLVTTNSVPHASSQIDIAALLASSMADMI